jgi:hypothetical protein
LKKGQQIGQGRRGNRYLAIRARTALENDPVLVTDDRDAPHCDFVHGLKSLLTSAHNTVVITDRGHYGIQGSIAFQPKVMLRNSLQDRQARGLAHPPLSVKGVYSFGERKCVT